MKFVILLNSGTYIVSDKMLEININGYDVYNNNSFIGYVLKSDIKKVIERADKYIGYIKV